MSLGLTGFTWFHFSHLVSLVEIDRKSLTWSHSTHWNRRRKVKLCEVKGKRERGLGHVLSGLTTKPRVRKDFALLTAALRSAGVALLSAVDILDGPHFDLSKKDVQQKILSFIKEGYVSYVQFGTPCTIWSQSRTRVSNLHKAWKQEVL